MEERILCLHRCHPLLHIIDDEHVNGLVEVYEVVNLIAQLGVGILYLEESGADV